MGTTLTGTTPQDTYDSLIKVTDNGPISGTLKALSDGLGNDSTLSLSTTAASIAGTLAVTGNATFDTSTLFVDAANNRVGIGTITPSTQLSLASASDVFMSVSRDASFVNFGVDAIGAFLNTSSTFRVLSQSGVTENVRFLSGGGMTFNGDTAAANALDDYEEGTWTPTTPSAGYTISASEGSYTKIGRQVTFRGKVSFSAVNVLANSDVRIDGLPLTIATTFTGIMRDDTTSGAIYGITASSTSLFCGSYSGVTVGSARTFAINEDYVFTVTCFV
jgi:hypothetical protein